mgnify:CR=1 FL=1
MIKRDINSWAMDLANTGRFRDWRAVEFEIRTQSRSSVKLDDPFWKREVDKACAVHWEDPDAHRT